MPDPEEVHHIKRLPPDVFAGVGLLMQCAGEILSEQSQLPEYSQVKEAGA